MKWRSIYERFGGGVAVLVSSLSLPFCLLSSICSFPGFGRGSFSYKRSYFIKRVRYKF